MRIGARRCGAALGLLALLVHAASAQAFEFFDGRLQIHGFYEAQLRSINQDFSSFTDDWDLTQFANVLNLEIELDIAPDGWGPFDFLSAFARVEARYDCVWTRSCGMFRSADVYGNRANKQPQRLLNGQRSGFTMNAFNFNTRPYRGDTPPPEYDLPFDDQPSGSRRVYPVSRTPGFFTLFSSPGSDQEFGTADDPGPFVFSRYFGSSRCKFSTRRLGGTVSEVALTVQNLGPVDPRCFVEPIAAANDKPNPFRGQVNYYGDPFTLNAAGQAENARRAALMDPDLGPFMGGDFNPITGTVGGGDAALTGFPLTSADLPLRPAPNLTNDAGQRAAANGLWSPNPAIARLAQNGDLGHFGGNFRQAELAWNRGQSQQDEKELKEAYLDLELLDSRLWMRVGKQSIVWGKTELFRNQDQFNPQDLALSSLPSLEESRIGLWSARAVYSLYDVGPLEDVRVELAMNFDQYESGDFGRCGEPYAVVLVCAGYYGFLAHGITGLGLAGVETPPNPWDDAHGIEYGGRVEWRWSRFSFALTDFYGFQDIPYVERVFHFQRNVDPATGIPRRAGRSGDCATAAFAPNPGYVAASGSAPGNRFFQPSTSGVDPDCLTVATALTEHHANLTVFTHSCATLIGLVQQAPDECGNQVFNSSSNFLTSMPSTAPEFQPIFSALLANQLSGNFNAWNISQSAPGALEPLFDPMTGARQVYPYVTLNVDPCDGFLSDCATPGPTSHPIFGASQPTLNTATTAQQQALLGCGEFWGTDCERDGVDLFNGEASVFVQSFAGFEGSFGDWDPFDASVAQPGTIGFQGGPVATRPVNGRLVTLPGARGPADPGYDVLVDGSNTGLLHPTAGWLNAGPNGFIEFGGDDVYAPTRQQFASEMAALSFNYMYVLAGLSLPPSAAIPPITEVDRPPIVDEFSNGVGGTANNGEPIPADPNANDLDLSNSIFRTDGCSLRRPQLCGNFQAFARSTRVQRNTTRAGGTSRFGRRDFQWHEGAPLTLRFAKANVLGFSTDFAEDWSKSNWSAELTWVHNLPFADADQQDGLSDVDTYNLTISVDRPTFVNFLNANRTFFVNSQVFIQYVDGYRKSFPSNGPWNLLATLTVSTGYFQDRLLPTATFVYDKRSNSGAFLPQLTYRFTENFSATFGVAGFWGRVERKTMSLVPPASGNRVTPSAYFDYVENGLSVVRDRDEAYLRIKYTF